MKPRAESPLSRFLPDADPSRGPFGVLGVSPDQCESDAVLAALRRALDRVTRHPEARTPDAEEVRLALHVAAAQLIDADTRQAMIEMWSTNPIETTIDTPPIPEPAPTHTPAPTPRTEQTLDAFRIACFEMIAHSGGWNALARRRVVSLADVFGVEPHELYQVFQPQHRTPTPIPSRTQAASTITTTPATTNTKSSPSISITTAALIVLNIIAALGLVRVIWPSQDPDTMRNPAQSSTQSPKPNSPAEKTAPIPMTSVPRDAADILTTLRQIRDTGLYDTSDNDPARLVAIDQSLANTWPDMPPRDLPLIAQTLDETIDKAQAISADMLDSLFTQWSDRLQSNDPARYRAHAWTAAAALRLSASTTARSATRQRANDLLATIPTDPPENNPITTRDALEWGLHAAAIQLATNLVNDTITPLNFSAAWDQWTNDAARVADWPPPRDTLPLDVFEHTARLETTQSSAHTLSAAMRRTLEAVNWHDQSAIIRLMSWLASDDALPAPALAIATVEVVSQRTDLPTSADLIATDSTIGPKRKALEERWAEALEIGVPKSRQRELANWVEQLKTATEPISGAQSIDDWLTIAVRTAQLNSAAHLYWQREPAAAQALMREKPWRPNHTTTNHTPEFSLGILTRPSNEHEAEWSVRYLNARNDPAERMTLLQEIRRRPSVRTQTDADVLADAAFYDPSIQVRQSAQQVIRTFSNDPRVIYAVLEALPRTARSESEREMIESATSRRLPPPRHPDWRPQAAKALLNRLFELHAKQQSTTPDQAAIELSRLYSMRITSEDSYTPLDDETDMNDVTPMSGIALISASDPPYAVAERLERELRAEAAIIARANELLAHDDLQTARRRLTHNEIERFAVAQLSCYELLSLITRGERLSRRSLLERIDAQTADARRSAATLTEQIAQTEAAMALVWRIRLAAEDQP